MPHGLKRCECSHHLKSSFPPKFGDKTVGCMPGTRSIEFLSMLANDVVQHDLGGAVTAIVLSAYVTKEGPVPAKVYCWSQLPEGVMCRIQRFTMCRRKRNSWRAVLSLTAGMYRLSASISKVVWTTRSLCRNC